MNFLTRWLDPARRFEHDYAERLLERLRLARSPGDAREFVPVRELDTALAKNPRIVLTGGPGAGKTTALTHLALSHARSLKSKHPGALVPIFFSARDLHPQSLPRRADYLADAIAANRALVLIDDLDALPTDAIENLVNEFFDVRIVASAQSTLGGFSEFKLPGFRDQDIEKFARLRFAEKADAFTAALKASGVSRALTSNPMTLALLAHAWTLERPAAPAQSDLHDALDIKPLPTRRTELFDAYAQNVLGNDDETARILEGVALAIQRGRPAPNEFVEKSRGFLVPGRNQTAEFTHDLWRAYFAARALRRAPDLSPLAEHFADPSWREVVLFYAGLNDATDLANALVQRSDLILAGYAIAHAQAVRADLHESLTKVLMERAWNGDTRATVVLGEMKSDAAVETFAAKLKEQDPQVRARAAEILGQLQMDRALEYLLPQMRDVNGDTRDKVIQALGHSLSSRVIEPLLVALRGDPRVGFVDTRLRVAAAKALGQVGSDKAVPALIVDLQTGEPEVRSVAADALKRIKSPLMIKPLKGIARTADEETRKLAADVLASVNGDYS